MKLTEPVISVRMVQITYRGGVEYSCRAGTTADYDIGIMKATLQRWDGIK